MTRFLTFVDRAGEYRWTLLASNGEPLAVSGEGYKAYASCLNGIEVVRESGRMDWPVYVPPMKPTAGTYYLYVDQRGEYRWSLYAKNGQCVAVSSEGYRQQASALRGIQLTKAAHGAPVVRHAA